MWVDSTNIGIFKKRTTRRWRLDKFGDDVVREKYCEAEVEAF